MLSKFSSLIFLGRNNSLFNYTKGNNNGDTGQTRSYEIDALH
jgi:hypothetical protein